MSRYSPFISSGLSYAQLLTRSYRGFDPVISCYGDSNTRYYEGDEAANGSITYAYSAYLDMMCARYPELFGATIYNKGYPGQNAQYGITNFAANVTDLSANICILGFGTNDIKHANADLNAYISKMTQLINLNLAASVVPIVLGIPWFYSGYAEDNEVGQARIPVWNARLKALCDSYGIGFIDTYKMFTEAMAATFFNEAVAKRHFSAIAQKYIAYAVVEQIKKIIPLNATAKYIVDRITPETACLNTADSDLLYETYSLGDRTINTLAVPTGKTITFTVRGKYCISFYPRITSTVTIGGVALPITAVADDGLYYPIVRYSAGTHGTNSVITLSTAGGAAYISGIACEEFPSSIFIPGKPIAPSAIPATSINGRKYFITTLNKEIVYSAGKWYDHTGMQSIGTTTERDALTNVPPGAKFYATNTTTAYTWTGAAWV